MTLKYFYTFVFSLFLSISSFAQNEDVLFTVDETPVYASEFKRVYLKNLELVKDESQKDVDEYLNLFTNYKLKLKEAEALGLNKQPVFKSEFENYRTQLLKNYIYDTKVTETLVKEAYERLKYEVDATHILVRILDNAKPEDSLKAYTKINEILKRATEEGFEKVQKEVSDGRTIIGEDLGYFTAFKMVYDFESAAFNNKVGDISKPFRTRFGYHILKVKNKRPSLGKIKVAHIMINKKDKEQDEEYIKRINDIHKRVEQGENFEALAKQFSEDKSSSSKGGKIDEFTSGQLSSETFEKMSFALAKPGDVSKPFKTKFGWHIVKLYEKKDLEDYDYLRPELEQKIRRDSRSRVINESRVEKLKRRYNTTINNPELNYFVSILNDKFYEGLWELPSNFEGDKLLVKIGEKELVYKDFGDRLLGLQRGGKRYDSFDDLVKETYKNFLTNELFRYQEENLEKENKEFAQIVEEFRDGLLIFDVMENEIWEASKKDTTALANYYNSHKENYFLEERLDAILASSASKKDVKKVAKLLKKGTPVDTIKKIVNTPPKVSVTFANSEFKKEDEALPKGLKFAKGVSKIFKHNKSYVVVMGNDVLPKVQQSFEDAKGKIISDYQAYLEKEWLKKLRNKYKISVNQSVLDMVKTELKS